MTSNFIILPLLLHMATAIVLMFLWKRITAQRIISVVSNVIILIVGVLLFTQTWKTGIITMQAGNWPAPFGITFVADVFSSTMVLFTAISALAVSIYSTVGINRARMKYGYFPIFHFLFMGLNGAFLTGDVFNLYVWFEIVIISSFVLMTLGGRKPQMESAIKYVAMNMLASVIFLTAIAILYGLTGSLNMADLSLKIAKIENRALVNVTGLLFFIGFGIKSAVFPLYYWLPSSYHTPPSAIAAIFGGLLTKVGIYALFRFFTLIFIPNEFITTAFSLIAVATLITGALGCLIKRDMRRMFSYLIVCHIGFMIAGLGLFTEVALAGALFYLFHDIIVKTNLFLVSGIIYRIKGTMDMPKLGGLYAEYPRLSLMMAIVFFSLVGIPPLSGFWPKINLFQAGFFAGDYLLIAALIIASFVTLYVIAKMWTEVFWKTEPSLSPDEKAYIDGFTILKPFSKLLLVFPVIMLMLVSLYIGFGAENIMSISKHIAAQMMDTSPYIKAVLGNEALNIQ